jgi:hypothetical protein
MIFQRERDTVLEAVEAWTRRHVPSRVIIGIVVVVLIVSSGIYVSSAVWGWYIDLRNWYDGGVTKARIEIQKAGTGTFLMTSQVWTFVGALLTVDDESVENIAIEQSITVDGCLLSATKRTRKAVVGPDKPRQLTKITSTDRFPLDRVHSLGGADKEETFPPIGGSRSPRTRRIYLILNENSDSSEQIEGVDEIPHIVSRSMIELYMYAQDFEKLGDEIVHLAKACGAGELIVVHLDRPYELDVR